MRIGTTASRAPEGGRRGGRAAQEENHGDERQPAQSHEDTALDAGQRHERPSIRQEGEPGQRRRHGKRNPYRNRGGEMHVGQLFQGFFLPASALK